MWDKKDDDRKDEDKKDVEDTTTIEMKRVNIEQRSTFDLRGARLPQRQDDSDFNPRKYRTVKNPLPLWMAYLNLLRIAFGGGALGIPLAISQAGLLLGSILSLLIGALLVYSHVMLFFLAVSTAVWLCLLTNLNEICKRLRIASISYRHGFRLAMYNGPPCCHTLGDKRFIIITLCMILSQLGTCTVFVIFTSDSLRDIMDWQSYKPALMTLLIPYMVMLFFMKNIKIVSIISVIGNIFNFIGLLLVCFLMIEEPRGDFRWSASRALPVLFALGSFLFNYNSVGLILNMDLALKDSEMLVRRDGVLSVVMSGSIVLATLFGSFGYWSFGNMEENILRSLPFDSGVSMLAIALYLVSIAFSYPLQCLPATSMIVDIIRYHDPDHEPSPMALAKIEVLCRPLFVMASFLLAYFVPFQGPVVAFVGCLCTSLLAVVFPALMEICILYPGPYGKYHIHLYKNLSFICFGLMIWFFGIVLNARLIYMRIKASMSPNNPDYV